MAVLDLVTRSSATARLAVPAVAVLTVAGLIVSRPRPRRPSSALAAALIAFAALAAPIVLSGEATWAGYIKLDDTSSWLGLVDRALTHGHSLAGVPPSTYRLVLEAYLAVGYPIGSFLPIGLGHVLLGQDGAWLVDPWMAFMAAMIALGPAPRRDARAHSQPRVAARGDRRRRSAAGAAVRLLPVGGIKEMAGAMLVAAFAVTAPLALTAVGGRARARSLIPALVVVWAMVASPQSRRPGLGRSRPADRRRARGRGLVARPAATATGARRRRGRRREGAADRQRWRTGVGPAAGGSAGAAGSGTTAGALPLVRQPVVPWRPA